MMKSRDSLPPANVFSSYLTMLADITRTNTA
jgi:hypothetical protein